MKQNLAWNDAQCQAIPAFMFKMVTATLQEHVIIENRASIVLWWSELYLQKIYIQGELLYYKCKLKWNQHEQANSCGSH